MHKQKVQQRTIKPLQMGQRSVHKTCVSILRTPSYTNIKVKKHEIYCILSQLISQLHFLSTQILENEPKEDIIIKELNETAEKIKKINESSK